VRGNWWPRQLTMDYCLFTVDYFFALSAVCAYWGFSLTANLRRLAKGLQYEMTAS